MQTSSTHRIGEVAEATGVTVETLRFYERERLLPPPARTTSGARRYSDDVFARVRFIKQAQAVGLTLRDIHVMVQSRQRTSADSCGRIRRVLAERIEDIDRRLHEMVAFRQVLKDHLASCDRAMADRANECPTLDAIARGGGSTSGAAR